MRRMDNIPVVRRPAQGRLEVHIPWREGGNRKVIKRICGTLTRPQWDGDRKRWMIARAHFTPLIGALKAEYGQVRVITAHCDAEGCDARCLQARGIECVCSCGGRNHGGLNSYTAGWRLVGTVASGETEWSEWRWIVSEGMSAAAMAAWIVQEGGRLTGTQLPVPGAEEIFGGFIRRFGQRDATRIARAAIDVHRGMWMGAPGPTTSSSPAASSPGWTMERKRRGPCNRGRARPWRVVPSGRDERRPALRAQRPDSYLILIAFRRWTAAAQCRRRSPAAPFVPR